MKRFNVYIKGRDAPVPVEAERHSVTMERNVTWWDFYVGSECVHRFAPSAVEAVVTRDPISGRRVESALLSN